MSGKELSRERSIPCRSHPTHVDEGAGRRRHGGTAARVHAGPSHAAPTADPEPTRALLQTDGIPPEILASISTPDTVETRLGTLEFFDGLPSPETVQTVYDNLDFLRGVEVFLNAMPGASTYAIRQGIRSLGVPDNSLILFQDQADSAAIFLTANTESIYSWGFLDLTDGPVVMETPPNVLGIFDDMWFRYIADFGNAGPDQGQGGSFLILPPGFSGEVPDGYYTYSSPTYGVLIIFRGFAVDGDPAPAAESIRANTRIYPLSEAQNRPETPILEVSGLPFNTVHPNDFTYYDEINHLVQEEPADALDPETTGLMASIGIVKGQEFKPDARMQAILKDSAAVANATARAILFRPRGEAFYFYPGEGSWYSPFVGGNYLFEQRGTAARCADPVFLLRHRRHPSHDRGAGRLRFAVRDQRPGQRRQLPRRRQDLHAAPAAQHPGGGLLVDRPLRPADPLHAPDRLPQTSVSSQTGTVVPNDDGSVDLWFGPEAPEGKEGNWAQTVPGKGWFVLLRLYGPGESWFDKTWRPGEIELVS